MTPSAFREPVLQALRALSGNAPGVGVPARDVTDLVFQTLGVDDPDPKVRNNANFCATQLLKGQGFLETPTRGIWALTPQGVKGSPVEALLSQGATLPPVDQPAPHRAPSPWEDDTVGASIYLLPVTDSYSDDPYIRSLAIHQTPCFGNHTEGSPICDCCPVAGSCRSKQVLLLSAIAATLGKRDEEAARQAAQPPPAPSKGEDIEDVLLVLEKQFARTRDTSPTSAGVEMDVPIESVCSVCKKTLREGTRAIYVVDVGFRHKTTCPA